MGMKTKKIKVLHRAATTGIGGVEQNVMNYYRHMDRERFQFDFLTRNAKLAEYKEVKELGINVKTLTVGHVPGLQQIGYLGLRFPEMIYGLSKMQLIFRNTVLTKTSDYRRGIN